MLPGVEQTFWAKLMVTNEALSRSEDEFKEIIKVEIKGCLQALSESMETWAEAEWVRANATGQ